MKILEKITQIVIDRSVITDMENHCLRKLKGKFKNNETNEKQAYGLLGGIIIGTDLYVSLNYALKQNYRFDNSYFEYMNKSIVAFADEGDLDLERRAWVSSPIETITAEDFFETNKKKLVGSYHMHHEDSWNTLSDKSICSNLDRQLGKDTGLFMFIVSILSGKILIKCFYEGKNELEIPIYIKGEQNL